MSTPPTSHRIPSRIAAPLLPLALAGLPLSAFAQGLPTMEDPSRGQGSGILQTLQNYGYDIVLLIALLGACSSLSPESRLRTGLEQAGLSPRMSACMAERMADRLSLTQLRKLQSLGAFRKSHSEPISVDRLLHDLRALGDTEIVAVTGKAALSCSF